MAQQRQVRQLLDDPVRAAEVARSLQPEDVAIAVGIDGVEGLRQIRAVNLYVVSG